MLKKLLFVLLSMLVVACGTSKSTTSRKPVTTKTGVRKSGGKTMTRKEIADQYRKAKEEDKSTGKQTVYSKPEILEATTRVKVTTQMVHEYINQFKETAKGNMRQYGIPASITLGQGILESGAGTGPLSALANNHFGIKCHKEWTGPSVSYDDDAAGECFRKYDDASQSYRDHSLFLTSRSRYAGLFELDKDDYKAWAKGLKAAGYATDPKYPEKLIGIIERYQLHKYDAEVMGKEWIDPNPVKLADNGDYYEVVKGDTLYSISRRFNITVDELRRKNNIQENSISIGQQLRIR